MPAEAANRLSIGVPAYNQGPFLAATLESLLALDPPPLEIVVADNHSTDETADVCARYADRVKVVRPPAHLPRMATNWNYVISQMRGAWVALLSSDDIALPDFAGTLSSATERCDDAVLVHAGFHRIDGEGRRLETVIRDRLETVTRAPQSIYDQFVVGPVSFAAFAIRRDAWKRVGGFPDEFILDADLGMWLRLAVEGAFVYEHEAVAEYRQYRDDKRLVPQIVRDQARIFLVHLPELVRDRDDVDPARLQAASRRWCFEMLRWAARDYAPDERAPLVEDFDAWARSCRLERFLARFAAGGTMPRKPYHPVRRAVVDLSHGVRTVLGRVGR